MMIEEVSTFQQGAHNAESEEQQEPQLWKLSLTALFYKNVTLYRKNYCSNICQILTPLVCLAFTLVVKMVVEQVTTGKVGSFPFPQPFHMPVVNKLIPGLSLNCSEKYYYSLQTNSTELLDRSNQLFHKILKTYCSQTESLVPEFLLYDDPNARIIEELRVTDSSKIERGVDMNTSLPDGKIIIKSLNNKSLEAALSINDWRLPEYHKNNGVTKMDIKIEGNNAILTYLRVTEGLMSLVEKITRSYLQMLGGENEREVIAGHFMYMPFQGADRSLIDKVTNVLGSGLYALGLSLLLPIFLYGIVSDKEQRLIQIMKMNGLLMKYYWISFFIFNFLISFISCCFLYFTGKYVMEITFFTSTSWQVLFLLFAGWSVAQVSLTSFVQVFINNSKTATIVGYLLSIFSSLVGQAICNVVYPFPSELPLMFLLFPPWGLARGIYLVGFACANNSDCYRDVNNLAPEMYKVYICLFAWFGVFIFSTFLHDMVQQQYGTSKLPAWLTGILSKDKTNSQGESTIEMTDFSEEKESLQREEENDHLMQTETIVKKGQKEEMDRSITEMSLFTQGLQPHQRPLIIKKIHKTYDNGFQALKPNSFSLNEREIFGLLGPNGAGKTTLISVLTGLYSSTGGVAWVDGKQIGGELTNLKVGVCPQFDLLWQNMTISEHMYFYGLLKGIPLNDLQEKVSSLLKDVDLLNECNMKSSQLSGGMKRRLSLAVALVGNPRVVFLDEPSSGLDPSHRRQMWDILLRCKARTTIFLTTHLMEEAETLCDRIGIINKGLLRCVGTQKQLKERFGKGYRLTINFKEWKGEQTQIIDELFGLGCQVVNDLGSRIMLKVAKQRMLQCVIKLSRCDSLSWLLSQPSLYDVFMYFVD